jgi:hypothetical protein
MTTAAYTHYNGTIAVKANWMIEQGLLKKDNYHKLVERGIFNRIRRACNSVSALIDFDSIAREDIKQRIVELAGDPRKVAHTNELQNLITPDSTAAQFYAEYRKPSGDPLSADERAKYTATAEVLNAIQMLFNQMAKQRSMGQTSMKQWKIISDAVNQLSGIEHRVPGSYRRVKEMYDKFKAAGYETLIHGAVGNQNSLVIQGEMAQWWLAQYALPIQPTVPTIMNLYNKIREEKQWPSITEAAIILWLNKPENKRLWMIGRNGKSDYIKNYGYTLQRDKSNWFPNAYWAIDGSKLDWIHCWDEARGMATKLKINLLLDVYSEAILGYSYSFTEDHTDHFRALKMAVSKSQCRPLLITHDNQSGHKTARMQDLYKAIVRHNKGTVYAHQAYRSSNPAEGVLGRFQKQVVNQKWFSDGQSIKARSRDSHANMDFIKEFKHKLYSVDQLIQFFEHDVKTWNEMTHPHFKAQSRIEVYEQHEQENQEPIDILDMCQMFWLNETKEITYGKDGLKMRLKDEIHYYEVYDKANKIDLEFRRKYVGEKFIVRYDPELMDKGVQLWQRNSQGALTFITAAQPKRAHESIPGLMREGDKEQWHEDFQVVQMEYQRDLAQLQKIRQATGITPEQLIEDQELAAKGMATLPKNDRSALESNLSAIHLL